MLSRALISFAMPVWLAPLIPYALLAAGALTAWLWFAGHYYDQGYAARNAELQIATGEFERRIARINAANSATGAAADAQIVTLRAQIRAKRTDVEKALADEPDFAAVRRPDRVHTLRVRDLDDLARAAADR